MSFSVQLPLQAKSGRLWSDTPDAERAAKICSVRLAVVSHPAAQKARVEDGAPN